MSCIAQSVATALMFRDPLFYKINSTLNIFNKIVLKMYVNCFAFIYCVYKYPGQKC